MSLLLTLLLAGWGNISLLHGSIIINLLYYFVSQGRFKLLLVYHEPFVQV